MFVDKLATTDLWFQKLICCFSMALTVHGGIGEDGTLQSLLEAEGVPHSGNVVFNA